MKLNEHDFREFILGTIAVEFPGKRFTVNQTSIIKDNDEETTVVITMDGKIIARFRHTHFPGLEAAWESWFNHIFRFGLSHYIETGKESFKEITDEMGYPGPTTL